MPGESGADWRISVRQVPDDGSLIVAAASLADVEETTSRLLVIDVVVMAVVLILLGVLAALLVRVGLRPLTRMEATAGHISAGDFARRVTDTDPHTEPGRLGLAMNAMLTRVESEITARTDSERRLRRFLADASHELRTPLTSIRGFAELSRHGGDSADAMRRIEAEAARMGILVEDLLLLARFDEQRTIERRPVDLLELCADVASDLHARSPHRTVRLAALDGDDGLIEPLTVRADPLRLRQVLGNLLTNADRHTPPEAPVTIWLGRATTPRDQAPTQPPTQPQALVPAQRPAPAAPAPAPASAPEPASPVPPPAASAGTGPPPGTAAAVIEVTDTGPGIPHEHAPYVFERLYRADPGRSGDGNGLGLSIAAALVAAHDGRIELLAPAPDSGATFRVLLPLQRRKASAP